MRRLARDARGRIGWMNATRRRRGEYSPLPGSRTHGSRLLVRGIRRSGQQRGVGIQAPVLLLPGSVGPSSDHVPVQARRSPPRKEKDSSLGLGGPRIPLDPPFWGYYLLRRKGPQWGGSRKVRFTILLRCPQRLRG